MTAGTGREWAPAVAAEDNALGDFLRARRDQVRPEDVGLVPGGQRRAPGLRREELAMLAGISAEYYLRLERGRAQHPSAQIHDALSHCPGLCRIDDVLLARGARGQRRQGQAHDAAEGFERVRDARRRGWH